MILSVLLFELSTISVVSGIAFFLICLAAAVIAFKMLKKTVKMAVRMAIVAVILIVALVGSIAFFVFGIGDSRPVRPIPTNQRNAR